MEEACQWSCHGVRTINTVIKLLGLIQECAALSTKVVLTVPEQPFTLRLRIVRRAFGLSVNER